MATTYTLGFFQSLLWCCCNPCTLLLAVCATSQTFASGFDKFGVLPTNDKQYVLVAGYNSNTVLRYTAQDLTFKDQKAVCTSPTGLAQAPGVDGSVFVACFGSNALGVLDPPSLSLTTVAVNGAYYGLAVANNSTVYGAEPNNLKQVTRWALPGFTSATALKPPSGTFQPFGVAVDPRSGNVLVTDVANQRLVHFQEDGTFIGTLYTESNGIVYGVAVDNAGNIYLPVYSASGKLYKLDSKGNLLGVYGGSLAFATAVAVDSRPDGSVWVYVTEETGSAHRITCMNS
jgi:DNA-binding beta-propeller fold protein YncE